MEDILSIAPIAVLHLSDFHFKNADNPALNRGDAIAVAVQSLVQPVSALFVVVTGDIAFSGLISEYRLADAFFRNLLERFTQILPGINVSIVFLPGNHDCDLRSQSDIRDYALLRPRLTTLDVNGAIVHNCVTVQDSYFSFVKEFGQEHATARDKLSKRIEFIAAGVHRIAFSIYNTAWLSQNPEQPGHLYIPKEGFISPDNPADVELALLHHPYNWLDPENMLVFRDHLEFSADVILSGHQHLAANYRVETPSGNSVYIIEGMAMHDPRVSQNGFNVVLIAPQEGQWLLHAFAWETDRYLPMHTGADWAPFARNKALEGQGFTNTPDFKSYLADPGVPFTHGNKQHILLSDIFVYPELRQRDLQKKLQAGKPSSALVRSKDVCKWLYDSQKVLLIGDDKCGKTSLAKTIYRDLQREYKVIPLVLSSESVEKFKPNKLKTLLEVAYIKQYGRSTKDAFFELPSSRRALILDDFHRCSLNRVARASFILNAELFFDNIIVLVDLAFEIDALVGKTSLPLFGGYKQYVISEMGHQLRGKLISKWVDLRTDTWTAEADSFQEVLEKEKVVESLLNRRMLPSYPIIILGMLQFLEASKKPACQYWILRRAVSATDYGPVSVGCKEAY